MAGVSWSINDTPEFTDWSLVFGKIDYFWEIIEPIVPGTAKLVSGRLMDETYI